MKKMDVLFIGVVLIVAAVFYFSGWLRPKEEGGLAVVLLDGQEFGRYSLQQDGMYTISQDGHENILEIKDGYADVTGASCKDKLCVNQKPIHLKGETIVCLPNRMVVEIEGEQKSDLDGVTG